MSSDVLGNLGRDLGAARHGERTTLTEVVLDVDDDQRASHDNEGIASSPRAREHLGGRERRDAPKLGWCCANNRYSWLGFASAAERIRRRCGRSQERADSS
ncbi:DUF5701 family protein [Yimella sp. RIT 621]|uniref:DUF5701 family protein n=1 Tax=Yimella sp. RIT 621 TaxID=2510323 RepID=UPI001F111B7B|nr:DUF5701 family protein [Yimella sp. RIT 621]